MVNLENLNQKIFKLISEKYHKLESHNPNHELLKYIENVTDEGFTNIGSKYPEMLLRFQDKYDRNSDLKLLLSYYITLRNAVNKI